MQRECTVVIVGYNSAHLLRDRIRNFGPGPIVVVDNASHDDSVSMIETMYPEVELIRNATNVGYGRAANQAFERVGTPTALLVNPDVEIDESGLLELEREARTLESGWLFLVPNTGAAPVAPHPISPTLERVDSASGAILLFDVATFRSLQGFDPNIFLFFEETDLCRRAREAGHGMFHAPHLRVEHPLGTSTVPSPAIDYLRKWHYHWSNLYFARKHRLAGRFAGALWSNLFLASLKLPRLESGSERFVRCHARRDATRRFLTGQAAFDASGGPFRAPMMLEMMRAGAALDHE